MKLLGFGKTNKNTSDDRHPRAIIPKSPLESSGLISESDYECLWILVCVTFNQVLPRIDLNLCVNERGEPALIALPDPTVSMASAKVLYEHPRPSMVLIQRIQQGEDKSYLVPVTYTDKQASILKEITSIGNTGNLGQGLKKYNWERVISEVKANNHNLLNDSSYWQEVNRIKILDNASPLDPDDIQTHTSYDREIPVFLYTERHSKIEISRDRLRRDMFLRKFLADNNIEEVRKSINILRPTGSLQDNDVLAYAISRVEAELQLNSPLARPPIADLMLDPEMAEFAPGSLSRLNLTAKGTEAMKKLESPVVRTRFSVVNWNESDIAHVALHISQSEGQSLKDSVTSPAITIFKDGMGIHTLPSHLFHIKKEIFSMDTGSQEPIFLDVAPASQIPEISLRPISEEATSKWWQTDVIAKKVLWLATQNLASHLVDNPEEVVCSVTPIGNDVIQISMLFDNLEAGAPYAFAIIRDFAFGTATVGDTTIHFGVAAIPIFCTGTWESQPDGSVIATRGVSLKNYIITTEGERIQDSYFITAKGERIKGTGIIMQFTGPIYSSVMSGKYKEPKFYEVGRP